MDQRPPPLAAPSKPQLSHSTSFSHHNSNQNNGSTSAYARHHQAQHSAPSNSPPTSSAYPSAPSASHAPTPTTRYSDHQRHPSDPSFYPPGGRPFIHDLGSNSKPSSSLPAPSPSNHSRHQSASSISSAPPAISRTMGPPGSPPHQQQQQPPTSQQQQQQQQQQHQQQTQQGPPSGHPLGHYGLPPPRQPPVPPRQSVSSYSSGRELPSINSINRTGSTGSSMSISSMLGGPLLGHREPQQHHPQNFPPSSSTPSSSGTAFAPTMHASPRMHNASTDFPPFRRPQTPDHPRPYDPRGSAAPSPQSAHYTPELQRYGTPQYHQQRGAPPPDHNRDPRLQPSGLPQRPSSIPPRPLEHNRPPPQEDIFGRRDDAMRRPPPSNEYNPERAGLKPIGYDDMHRIERDRQIEAEQREREREQRDRALSTGDLSRSHPYHPDFGHQGAPRGGHQPYHDPREPRDQRDQRDAGQWPRHVAYDPARLPFESPGHQPRHPEYPPPSTGPPYSSHPPPVYAQPPPDRYPPHSQPPHEVPGVPGTSAPPPPIARYETSPERQRLPSLHPHQHQQGQPIHQHYHPHTPQQPSLHRPPPQNDGHPGAPYGPAGVSGPFDPSRGRPHEEPTAQHAQNRGHLAIQEINRTKGRISPLPQAVQGAQPQLPGPAGGPGIKSEFGRVFSGLGGGIGGLGVSSPVTAGPPTAPLANASTDPGAQDSGADGATKSSKGRRRKLKDEDTREEDNSGRVTPDGRAKRPKTLPHHHHHHRHHHHHHRHKDAQDGLTQPSYTGAIPFKAVKGSTPIPSPTGLPRDHHNHASRTLLGPHSAPGASRPAPIPVPTVIPQKPKQIISSKAVLESVADKPRYHLGDVLYEPTFQPARLVPNVSSSRGFSTVPTPLPLERIRGKENCTLTVKIPKVHLTPSAREEITARRAVWGTEVYTDDSDVVAACVHGGWIRGEWPEDVDVGLLDLDRGIPNDGAIEKNEGGGRRRKEKESEARARREANEAVYLSSPPRTGPVTVPPDKDMHVTLLVLPKLSKYTSTTRFGIQSREFGSGGTAGRQRAAAGTREGRKPAAHDGLSFMILGVRWVENGAGMQSRLRGKARRERMRKAMKEVTISFQGMSGVDAEAEKEMVRKLRADLEGGGATNGGDVGKAPMDSVQERRENGDHDFDKENLPAIANGVGGAGGVGETAGGEASGESMEGVEKSVEKPAAEATIES